MLADPGPPTHGRDAESNGRGPHERRDRRAHQLEGSDRARRGESRAADEERGVPQPAPVADGVDGGHHPIQQGLGTFPELAGAPEPGSRVTRHGSQHELLDGEGNARLAPARGGRRSIEHSRQRLGGVPAGVGRHAGERVVEDRAGAVDVGADIRCCRAPNLLRSHVEGST